MDALSEVLRLVRLSGAVFLNAELTAPWALRTPSGEQLARVLMPEAEHLIEYHLVVQGRCFIAVDGEAPLQLDVGDLVMVPRGDSHRMSSGAVPTVPLLAAEHMDLPPAGVIATPRYGGGGALTRIVCGFLAIDRRLCAPLLDALPRVLRVSGGSSEVDAWLRSWVRMSVVERADDQPGGACVLAKLSELMFVEAIRRYVESLPAERQGWLAGLKDPHVGKALGLLHGKPARAWTVDELAREVGLSRSALAERFTALIGTSPMQYLTQWRLALAAHHLRTTAKPAATIAYEVGYESEAAFNRAFRREYGAPPATWRRGARVAVARQATDATGAADAGSPWPERAMHAAGG